MINILLHVTTHVTSDNTVTCNYKSNIFILMFLFCGIFTDSLSPWLLPKRAINKHYTQTCKTGRAHEVVQLLRHNLVSRKRNIDIMHGLPGHLPYKTITKNLIFSAKK